MIHKPNTENGHGSLRSFSSSSSFPRVINCEDIHRSYASTSFSTGVFICIRRLAYLPEILLCKSSMCTGMIHVHRHRIWWKGEQERIKQSPHYPLNQTNSFGKLTQLQLQLGKVKVLFYCVPFPSSIQSSPQ